MHRALALLSVIWLIAACSGVFDAGPLIPTQVASSAGEPEPRSTAPPPYHRGTGTTSALEGRWQTSAITMNGRPSQDPEMTGAWWIFQGDELLVCTSHNLGQPTSRYTFEMVSDAGGTALRISSKPGSIPQESGWMNYELTGQELRLAFFDGLGRRPNGFAPESPRSEPKLVVVTLRRVD